MKILHLPFTFYPDPVGGTEVYVEALARLQQAAGMDVVVAAPGAAPASYPWGTLPVRRFVVADPSDLREMYGEGDPEAAAACGQIFDRERPDVVHLHAFTRGVSLRVVREAKRRRLPVVFTYHTPTVSCQRGTMMRWGKEPCGGVLDVAACASCAVHGRGAGRVAGTVAGWIPESVGVRIGASGLAGGLWTALRMTELMAVRQTAFHGLLAEVDHVVAVCDWVKAVLVRNGLPAHKATLSRQGLARTAQAWHPERVASRPEGGAMLRIAYVGRLDAAKGVDVLVRTIAGNPALDVLLDVYGIAQGSEGARYLSALEAARGEDPRIRFLPPVPQERVVETLAGYQALVVPSQWLETGPLVVLEAFAAGVPVVGSRLGGIAELVRDRHDGLLVDPPDSPAAWHDALRLLIDTPSLLNDWRRNIVPPRQMEDVCSDMSAIYARLTTGAQANGLMREAVVPKYANATN